MNSVLTKENLLRFGRTLNVLYVEDSDETREVVSELFENYFNNVIVANDGDTGLSKFDDSIDLIVTDINMPHIIMSSFVKTT
ncbi:MAG: response regulator [Campylobacterota bacterium]|nr:response regulator [Campylobacterota bacterium]